MVSLVRPAEVSDAAAIARVHVATWRSTYRGLLPEEFLTSLDVRGYTDRWRRIVADSTSRVYVAENAQGVIGFASGGRERAGEGAYSGELYAIYILEEAQGRGHGRRLVQAVVNGLRDLELPDMIVWVLRENAPARRFYERLGGVYVREQPITIGSAQLQEVSYGWKRLTDVRY
jgi:ribosomal protein S18 acetylase RimI-like enzyme